MTTKPLGRKSYGSIGHLPESRMGPGDHSVHAGQSDICLRKTRDRHDVVIVQEKLDGSCCSVAKVDGVVHALGRAGYPASTSRFEQHHYFAVWVRERVSLFQRLLREGERIVGEWMAQAHGTIYETSHPQWAPFVPFDLMNGPERACYADFLARLNGSGLIVASPVHIGGPLGIEEAMSRTGRHGAIDPVEGVVYRVEREGRVDFLAKWVRHDKADGKYLPDVENFCGTEHWHWKPASARPAA